jgi:hypothetical protein
VKQGYAARSIYRYISKADANVDEGDGRRSNGPERKIQGESLTRLKRLFNGSDKVSQRTAAPLFNVNQSTICRTLQQETKIKYYKKQSVPAYAKGQEITVQRTADRLYRSHMAGDHTLAIIVQDDEFYIDENGASGRMDSGYYAESHRGAPVEVWTKKVKKFSRKVGVWYAISENGISNHFSWIGGLAINKDIYLEECIEKRLIPFIREYHQNDEVLFWPDKASAHYAKVVIEKLESARIKVVPYSDNPTNLPQARPIEHMHALIKNHIFSGNYKPKNAEDLKSRVDNLFPKLQSELQETAMRMMGKVRGLVRSVAREGVYSIVK